MSLRLKPALVLIVALFGLQSAIATAPAAGQLSVPVYSAAKNGKVAVLVPAPYPKSMSGRQSTVRLDVWIGARRITIKKTDRPHSGTLRTGDKRKNFRYIHAVPLNRALSKRILSGKQTEVQASVQTQPPGAKVPHLRLILDGLGKTIRRAPATMCSSAPLLLVASKAGAAARTQTPWCGSRVKWSVSDQPDYGQASIETTGLTFVQDENALGADEVELTGRSGGKVINRQKVQLRISNTAADSISVVAMGDSVTAGFGYYGATGKPMTFTQLFGCSPAQSGYNDACSSNALNTKSKIGKTPDYVADYGLSRNISWAAQWANEYGITDYRNYAVSGSAPSDWLPGGQFGPTLASIQQQNPEYIVMTMGANPILHNVLFGIDDMGCALESDLFGDYRACVLAAFDKVNLSGNLKQLYTQLVANTTSKIVLMQYHLSVPSAAIAYTAQQIEMMQVLMNQIIEEQADAVSTSRINVVAPPRFNVGIDMSPMYPSRYSCSWAGFKVDGPSVQSTPSQDFLETLHPASFCSGPPVGPPWVISGDTGIHPSVAGYSQMASQIPAPE